MGVVTKEGVGAFRQGRKEGTLIGYANMSYETASATGNICPGAVHESGIVLMPKESVAVSKKQHSRTAILKYEFCPTTISSVFHNANPEVTVTRATVVSAYIIE
jgi:hypothetical protein